MAPTVRFFVNNVGISKVRRAGVTKLCTIKRTTSGCRNTGYLNKGSLVTTIRSKEATTRTIRRKRNRPVYRRLFIPCVRRRRRGVSHVRRVSRCQNGCSTATALHGLVGVVDCNVSLVHSKRILRSDVCTLSSDLGRLEAFPVSPVMSICRGCELCPVTILKGTALVDTIREHRSEKTRFQGSFPNRGSFQGYSITRFGSREVEVCFRRRSKRGKNTIE